MADNDEAVVSYEEIMSEADLFQKHLDELNEKIDGITYSIVATVDGFPVAYTHLEEKNAAGRAALAASLDGLGETVSIESQMDSVDAIHVECSNGFVFCRNIDLEDHRRVALLLATTNKGALGTLLWHIKNTSDEMKKDFVKAKKTKK
ncbi:MAG: roadblock/LC7 domain-containing protein [Neisseriaceae bacterium]|nr:roadblock/LC7 domain-containing protein [Neisseriaceae bacterium]